MTIAGCQTVKQKTDAIVEKENEKLSEFIGKSASKLQMELGKPDEDFKNAKGNFEFVYNTKKYLIPCFLPDSWESSLLYFLLLLVLQLLWKKLTTRSLQKF